jgi:pimeloyl-ACP methyl ester carboxylesterase
MTNTVTVKNKSVVYHVSGVGKPLVLVHGFGFDASAWEPLLAELENHACVVRVELPGVGGSDLPDGDASIDAFADAVAAVIIHERIGPCPVIGHSMGGYVVMSLLERHNDLVEAIGLFHSHPFADDDAKKEKRLKDADFIERNGSDKFIQMLIPGLFADGFKKNHNSIVNGLVDRYKKLSAESLAYSLRAMASRPDRSTLLGQVKKPVLQVIGLVDAAVPPELTLRTMQLVSVSNALVMKEVAHMGMFEATALCKDHIVSWMNSLRNA